MTIASRTLDADAAIEAEIAFVRDVRGRNRMKIRA